MPWITKAVHHHAPRAVAMHRFHNIARTVRHISSTNAMAPATNGVLKDFFKNFKHFVCYFKNKT
jgi:hypothetical protein